MLLNLFRKKPPPSPPILTEQEFKFLADGVPDGGMVGAWSGDAAAMEVARGLVAKGCLRRGGSLPGPRGTKSYTAWIMTSKGVDAALGGFTPAPGWRPW